MSKVTVIIPSGTVDYMDRTVQSILDGAKGEIEIIVNLDGYFPADPIRDPRITYIYNPQPIGMRGGINNGLLLAKGEYVMKSDDHCIFGEGWDEILKRDCQKDWLLVPRRYSLGGDWKRDETRPLKDYHYLTFPQRSQWGTGIYPAPWHSKSMRLKNTNMIDDIMTFQGSCWFADKDYFMEHVGLLDGRPETYSSFSQEQVEIGMKYWLGGGAVKVDKNTWYAHLSKNKNYYRGGKRHEKRWKKNKVAVSGNEWSTKHWMNDEEPGMKYNFEWFVNKFWPIPRWPENWKEKWNEINKTL